METLGVLGIGLLGSALAERFLAARFQVLGFDPQPAARQRLVDLGGSVADSPRQVFATCRRVILSLPDSDIVERVLAEIDPAPATRVILDTTTGDPDRMAATGQRLAASGITYLDTCVLGSSEQTRAGEVLVLAGGPRQAIEENDDLFRSFSRRCCHVGDHGAGGRMKLVVNLVLGLNRAVLAEGLALAAACGLDQVVTLDILRAGAAYSRVMDTKGEKMLTRDFSPQARLAQHLKDVRLILAQAQRHGGRVPLSTAHEKVLELAVALGAGEQDNSAILRAFETPPE